VSGAAAVHDFPHVTNCCHAVVMIESSLTFEEKRRAHTIGHTVSPENCMQIAQHPKLD
jgi:hypothetical protein